MHKETQSADMGPPIPHMRGAEDPRGKHKLCSAYKQAARAASCQCNLHQLSARGLARRYCDDRTTTVPARFTLKHELSMLLWPG